MEDFEWPCCIRGYHIYKEIWDAAIGEHLACERENSNNHDCYAVAVTKDRTIVGHLPRKVSRVCFKSLIIHCTINFASGIFKVGSTYEIILTAKLSRSTVFVWWHAHVPMHWDTLCD